MKISLPGGAKFPVLWHYAQVAGDNDGPGAAAPQIGVAGAHSPATPRQAVTSGDQQPALIPSISSPKGGGAVRGIGEKFSTNPAAGSLSVPIATFPGRVGFELSLELAYDSGAGNSAFGLGWHLSTPSVTRKTDKGLPRYVEDSDVSVLSGAEALVLVRVKDGAGTRPDAFDCGDYRVQRRRPRTERLFAHIERWTSRTTSHAHWRAITRDNVLNIYGRSPTARIADPNAPPESSPGCSRRSTTTAATSVVTRTRPKTMRASIRARRVAASPGST